MAQVRDLWRALGQVKGAHTSYSFGKVNTLKL